MSVGQVTVDHLGRWCRIMHDEEAYVGELVSVKHERNWRGDSTTFVFLRNNRDWRWHKVLPGDHSVEWIEGDK